MGECQKCLHRDVCSEFDPDAIVACDAFKNECQYVRFTVLPGDTVWRIVDGEIRDYAVISASYYEDGVEYRDENDMPFFEDDLEKDVFTERKFAEWELERRNAEY